MACRSPAAVKHVCDLAQFLEVLTRRSELHAESLAEKLIALLAAGGG
jgi:hypothetical protein